MIRSRFNRNQEIEKKKRETKENYKNIRYFDSLEQQATTFFRVIVKRPSAEIRITSIATRRIISTSWEADINEDSHHVIN